MRLFGIEQGPGAAASAKVDVAAARLNLSQLTERTMLAARETKQLLGFARRGQYDPKSLELAKVVKEVSEIFARTHPQVTLLLEVDSSARVLMDHAQLEQVLLNLFINAGQAMPGAGTIHVFTPPFSAPEPGPRPLLSLVVADQGIGMDVATQARIFEPFFTTKGIGLGTGLGLASVFGILQNHGGSISVESAPGLGAAFTLRLPATDRLPEAAPVPPASTGAGVGTLLLVDDEPMLLNGLSRLLRRDGYQVLTASRGHQAVELLRQHGSTIALVILDLTMPEMSGAETFEALRALVPDLKVLLSSGYTEEDRAQELLLGGACGFIQKPFTLEALRARLDAVL